MAPNRTHGIAVAGALALALIAKPECGGVIASDMASTASEQEEPLVLGLPVRVSPLAGTMKLPVIEGALINQEDWLLVLGGMKKDFTASPAIQMRTPQGVWRPVGAQMREARINPWALQLSDGRVFVWGGYGGSARGELEQRLDGELLKPKVAGSSVLVTPPVGIDWSGASNPALLDEGIVGMVVKDQLHRFDPGEGGGWVAPIPLGHTLQGATLTALENGRVLACGTNESGTGVQVIEVELGAARVTHWPEGVQVPALGGRLLGLPGGRLLLVGWTRVGAGLESRTLLLDPSTRTTTMGPELPIDSGQLNWMSSHAVAEGALVLATLTTEEKGAGQAAAPPRTVAFLIRAERAGSIRVWSLSKLPARRRAMVLPVGQRSIELIGGYRFEAKGAVMENTSTLVNYGAGLIGD